MEDEAKVPSVLLLLLSVTLLLLLLNFYLILGTFVVNLVAISSHVTVAIATFYACDLLRIRKEPLSVFLTAFIVFPPSSVFLSGVRNMCPPRLMLRSWINKTAIVNGSSIIFPPSFASLWLPTCRESLIWATPVLNYVIDNKYLSVNWKVYFW